MRIFLNKKGASQTEYIIIVVLIAVSTMAAVGKYGNEIKSLFQKSTAKLSLFDGNSRDENSNVSGGDEGASGGDEEVAVNSGDEASTSGSEDNNQSDENKKSREECMREYTNLMNEKRQEEQRFNRRMHSSMARERQFRRLADHYALLASRFRWFHSGSVSINFQIFNFIFGTHGHYHSGGSSQRDYYLRKAEMYRRLAGREAEFRRREQERHRAFLENWNLKMQQWQQECGGRH